jgi:hypothetical protein
MVVEPRGSARLRLSTIFTAGDSFRAKECPQLVETNGGRGRTRTCDLLRVKQRQRLQSVYPLQ